MLDDVGLVIRERHKIEERDEKERHGSCCVSHKSICRVAQPDVHECLCVAVCSLL